MGNFLNNISLNETCVTDSEFDYSTRQLRRISASELCRTRFKLKDTVTIPIGERNYVFVVEHIRLLGNDSKKVYFVAKDIINKSTMIPERINHLLDVLEEEMPKSIISIMEQVEHERNGINFTRKLNLLSSANLRENDECVGYDDIPFKGFEMKVDRCKGYDGETGFWWLCDLYTSLPYYDFATSFEIVSARGNISAEHCTGMFGIVPCFAILCNE